MPAPVPPTLTVALARDYDVSSLTAVNGDIIQTVPDLLGGVSLTQGTAAARPTFTTNYANGYPALVFDAVDDWISATVSEPQPVTWVVIGSNTGAAGSNTMVLDSPNTNSSRHFIGRRIVNALDRWVYYTTSAVQDSGISALFVGNTNPSVFILYANAATSVLRVNGNAGNTGGSGTGASASQSFGRAAASAAYTPARIARFLVYRGQLTEADNIKLESWVQDTYGITVANYQASGGGAPVVGLGTLTVTSALLGTGNKVVVTGDALVKNNSLTGISYTVRTGIGSLTKTNSLTGINLVIKTSAGTVVTQSELVGLGTKQNFDSGSVIVTQQLRGTGRNVSGAVIAKARQFVLVGQRLRLTF